MEVVATDDDTEHRSTSGLAANEDAHIQDVSSAVSDESELESADSDCNDDDCDHEAFIQHLSTLPENGNTTPFASERFALLYTLLHSAHPLGERNLKFILHIIKKEDVSAPSLYQLKKFSLPGYHAPSLVYSDLGEPFYMNKPIDVIRRCFGDPDISKTLQRIPVSHSDIVTSSCSSLPLTVQDEMYILGKEMDALFTQVRGLVSCPSRILVEKPLCPLCEMSIQEFQAFIAPHPLKAKGNGKAVVVTPLLLYSDDLSGNLSKQWNLLDCWCILFAGLPRKMNHQLGNIHLLCASNTVSAVQMMGPIVSELCALEQGVEVFDEKTQECVLVVAPVLAIMCDNPRASQIVGHMTGRPSKFCRVCLADANESSDMIAELRTKASSMVEFAKISFANGSAKAELKTLSGLCDMPTPILKLTLDPYQGTPLEALHTLVLGPLKYFLHDVMSRLTKKEKEQMQAFMNAFDYSGFEVIPKPKRICNYSGSLVGRDIKAFAQMALFILEPYLSAGEKEVWIAMLKVFRIAYCGTLRTSMLDAYQGTCDAFVQAIKEHNPSMLKKKKVHLVLHLPAALREFGPTSGYNTERCEAFNSLVRCQNVHSNRHNPSRDIAVGFSVREHLTYVVSGGRYGPNNERCSPAIRELFKTTEVLHFMNGYTPKTHTHGEFGKLEASRKLQKLSDVLIYCKCEQSCALGCLLDGGHYQLQQHGAEISMDALGYLYKCTAGTKNATIKVTNCIKLFYRNKIQYGILHACFMERSGLTYCLIQLFEEMVGSFGEPILNDIDCPLLTLTKQLLLVPPSTLVCAVSICHQCSSSCTLKEQSNGQLLFKHDWNNDMYAYNIYCMSND
eukprot:Em0002g1080a